MGEEQQTPDWLLKELETMKERIVCLEREVRCTHLFKNYDDYMECVRCNQRKGF